MGTAENQPEYFHLKCEHPYAYHRVGICLSCQKICRQNSAHVAHPILCDSAKGTLISASLCRAREGRMVRVNVA